MLLRLLREWQSGMESFLDMLEVENGEAVETAFKDAGHFRSQLPERRKGMLHAIYECYIDVPDHPGIIGKVATELGNSAINLEQYSNHREQGRRARRAQAQLPKARGFGTARSIGLGEIGYAVHF